MDRVTKITRNEISSSWDGWPQPVSPICPACGGSGTQYSEVTGTRVVCPVCGGSGQVKRNIDGTIKTIDVSWEAKA